MRLTINLDDDLYAMARAHAIVTKTSLSKAVGDLLRRRATDGDAVPSAGSDAGQAGSYFDPVLGIEVSRCDGLLTEGDIQRAIDDDDLRHMEAARALGTGGRP